MANENQTIVLQQQSLKDKLLSYVAIGLMIFLAFKSCNNQKQYSQTIIHSDTTINNTVFHKDTILNKVPKPDTIYPYIVKVTDTQWLPNKDIEKLTKQYEELRDKFLALNVTKDTFPIDTIGSVYITDTINQNKITGRTVNSVLNIPIKTITITNTTYVPHKNIWMWGINLGGDKQEFVKQFGADILLITKQDKGYRIGAKIGTDGKPIYEGGIYFKF